jgi:DNA (cytosine-5)-methyltransferase 1
VPPLKAGSALSIPSPPAIWDSKKATFFTPGIGDAERLQGFEAGWTKIEPVDSKNERARWRLVGNAVSVPVVTWIGQRILSACAVSVQQSFSIAKGKRNNAGSGERNSLPSFGFIFEGPSRPKISNLRAFRFADRRALSERAAKGFLSRVKKSPLKVMPKFVSDLESYVS